VVRSSATRAQAGYPVAGRDPRRNNEPTYHKIEGITDRAMQALLAQDWPGNVRELENLIERGVLLAQPGGQIELEHLFAAGAPEPQTGVEIGREGFLGDAAEANRAKLYEAMLEEGFGIEAHERQLVELAVRRANGSPVLTKGVLLVLGVGRSALRPQPSFGRSCQCSRKATVTCRSTAKLR
jgi:two-component system, NtrC family, response regulator HydG